MAGLVFIVAVCCVVPALFGWQEWGWPGAATGVGVVLAVLGLYSGLDAIGLLPDSTCVEVDMHFYSTCR